MTEPVSDQQTTSTNTPRITNDNEGTKEQKLAVKRLSAYSEEVSNRQRKLETVPEETEVPQGTSGETSRLIGTEEPEHKPDGGIDNEAPPSGIPTNIVTILGLIATVGGLYYLYKTDRREEFKFEVVHQVGTDETDVKPSVRVPKKKPKFRTL